jgi:bacillithiol system protein YtxJ
MPSSFFSSGSPSRIAATLVVLAGVVFLLIARRGEGSFLWVAGVMLCLVLARNVRVARVLRRSEAGRGGGGIEGAAGSRAGTEGVAGSEAGRIRRVQDPDTLEAVLGMEEAILFKHSVLCGISSGALVQVERFAGAHPEVPVFQVNVIEDRPLSNEVEMRTGVRHASPQVILLRSGEPVADMSHGRIREEALRRLVTDGA